MDSFVYAVARTVTMQFMRQAGFDRAHSAIVDLLTDVFVRLIAKLALRASDIALLVRRTDIAAPDVLQAMIDLRIVSQIPYNPSDTRFLDNFLLWCSSSDVNKELITVAAANSSSAGITSVVSDTIEPSTSSITEGSGTAATALGMDADAAVAVGTAVTTCTGDKAVSRNPTLHHIKDEDQSIAEHNRSEPSAQMIVDSLIAHRSEQREQKPDQHLEQRHYDQDINKIEQSASEIAGSPKNDSLSRQTTLIDGTSPTAESVRLGNFVIGAVKKLLDNRQPRRNFWLSGLIQKMRKQSSEDLFHDTVLNEHFALDNCDYLNIEDIQSDLHIFHEYLIQDKLIRTSDLAKFELEPPSEPTSDDFESGNEDTKRKRGGDSSFSDAVEIESPSKKIPSAKSQNSPGSGNSAEGTNTFRRSKRLRQ